MHTCNFFIDIVYKHTPPIWSQWQGNGLDELHPWKIVQGSDICMVILGVFLTLSGMLIFLFILYIWWTFKEITRGYFTWSFIDMLELMGGCEPCFGLYHVDIDDPQLKRHEKLSAHWYSHFLKGSPVGSAGQHFSPFLSPLVNLPR